MELGDCLSKKVLFITTSQTALGKIRKKKFCKWFTILVFVPYSKIL